MIKLMAFRSSLRPRDDRGAPRSPSVIRHRRNLIVDTQQRIAAPRDRIEAAAIEELWLEDPTGERADPLLSDWLRPCMGIRVVVERPVIDGPAAGIKRMAAVRRRPDLSPDAFQRHWFQVHGAILRRMPGVVRYVQHHVVEPWGQDVLEVDGFVEIWFPDIASMDAGFASKAGQDAAADLAHFAASVATFVTQSEKE